MQVKPATNIPDLPPSLIAEIREGRVVLFLGAGASMDASDLKGNRPPSGTELAAKLSKTFLGGKYSDASLARVAEYAVSETDSQRVHNFIAEELSAFQPVEPHKSLCEVTWWGLATTNYDRLIEKAYEVSPHRVQKIVPIVRNGDRIEEYQRDKQSLLYLKLHGCVTDSTTPIILTPESYNDHRHTRDRIFRIFEDWAYERTIVFIGTTLEDLDIRAIIQELTKRGEARPRYYYVSRKVDDIQRRFWESRRISPIEATFASFMEAVKSGVSNNIALLASMANRPAVPLSVRITVPNGSFNPNTVQFLDNDAIFIEHNFSSTPITPKLFYRGVSSFFAGVDQNLDIRRPVGDEIIQDYFLRDLKKPGDKAELIVITAEAGAGKTVLLQRVAADAAREYGCLCLYLKAGGKLQVAAIQEIIELTRERVFLFVDDLSDHSRELERLLSHIGKAGQLLTVIAAERTNEWNVAGDTLVPFVSAEYELPYLTSGEIDNLLKVLTLHRALGTLEKSSLEDRRKALAERAGRQLLVALHEATLGESFEDIIENEFRSIIPAQAQQLYLTVCFFNRLNIPVRAGLISRLHGVRFEEFEKTFLRPLERVVLTSFDPLLRDYLYQARHPEIAQMVFDRVLGVAEDRLEKYSSSLRELNIDYSPDRKAFWELIKGRSLADLFPDHDMVESIYNIAYELVDEDAGLLHQWGLYHLHRRDSDLVSARNLLERAESADPTNKSIKHSLAELNFRTALASKTRLEKDHYLSEAKRIATALKNVTQEKSYAFHTLLKVAIAVLEDTLADEAAGSSRIHQATSDAEAILREGLQAFPQDPFLLDEESRLADLLRNSSRAEKALSEAFAANQKNAVSCLRLSRLFEARSQNDDAIAVLKRGLAANPSDKRLHFALAKLLFAKSGQTDEIEYHLQRSFSPGDHNYDAQLLYARQLFLNGNIPRAEEVNRGLRTAYVPQSLRNKVMYTLSERRTGTVQRVEVNYVLIKAPELTYYAHFSNSDGGQWKRLTAGTAVTFQVSFTLRGIRAVAVKVT